MRAMDPEPALLDRVRAALQPVDAPHPEPPGGQRRASVLLLLDSSGAGLPLLFLLRSANLRQHPGQVAFPGGGEEQGDAGVVATALREAHEEVGVDPANVDVLGLLQPMVTAVSDRWLTPVVGLQRGAWEVRPDAVEVADWFRVDVAELMRAPHTVRELSRDGRPRAVHFYEVQGRVIWGVTAAIVHDLLTRLERGG